MVAHAVSDPQVLHDDTTSHIEEVRRRTFLELESEEPELPFDHDEWHELHDDDNAAGARLSRILTSLFFYSCMIMLVVAWWTWRSSQ